VGWHKKESKIRIDGEKGKKVVSSDFGFSKKRTTEIGY
jgi:hypothetical protein